MRDNLRHRYDAYLRAQHVCAEHSPLLDVTPGGQKMRAALGNHLAEVDRLLAVQDQSITDGRVATNVCRRCRRGLRAAAKAIVMVGRLVNRDGPIVGPLRVPGAMSDDQRVACVRDLLERVSACASFVAHGLPRNLPKRLDKDIEDLVAARKAQAAARQRFTAASGSIADALDRARKTIDVLEAILVHTVGDPSDVLTQLRLARRVERRVTAPECPHAASADQAA